jgi:hypothetical protein
MVTILLILTVNCSAIRYRERTSSMNVKNQIFNIQSTVIVTARYKARNIFARSKTGVMGSNPSRSKDIDASSDSLILRLRSPTDCV